MKKIIFLSVFIPFLGFSQEKGVRLFTGASYFQSGIGFEDIEFELNEDTWTSNRLPINTDFEIKLIKPRGFVVTDGNCFPGVSILILKPNKDTLGYSPNIFGNNQEGMDYSMLSNLSLSLRFNEQAKVGDTLNLKTSFFDTKGKNETKIEMNVVIVDSKLPLENTKSVYSSSSTNSYETKSTFEIGEVKLKNDTIQTAFYKTLALERMDLDIKSLKAGHEYIRLFDQNKNEITNKDIIESLQIEIKKSEEFSVVEPIEGVDRESITKSNLKIFIPASTKNTSKKYYLYYRWESLDKSKVFEIMNPFNL
ncbi:MAG: hypothetical protein V4622_05295 [Bacteroidota bacterium]